MTKQDKQQNTIREMANKKLLTGEQKKVLYKLFEAKIDNLKRQKSDELNKIEIDKATEITKEAKNNKTIKNLLAIKTKAEKDIKEAVKSIENLGFHINYNGLIEIDYSEHKEIIELRRKEREKLRKIEELKAKLLADIYCLPMTAQEMTSYIEDEIKAIDKSI